MSTESTEFAHSLLITLSVVVIVLLLINTFLLVSRNKTENWDNKDTSTMWDNGQIYNGFGLGDNKKFEVKLACSCSGYGVKRPNDQNMPYNNDSNLYNSPAQLHMLPKQEQQ